MSSPEPELCPVLLRSQDRESGGYADSISDIQYIISRLRTVSTKDLDKNINEKYDNCIDFQIKQTSGDKTFSQANTDEYRSCNQVFAYSASSVESLPSPSGSSAQALVCSRSNSSFSTGNQIMVTPICKAKALIDSFPNPYDNDTLMFKKGETIDVLAMNASGVWKGACHGRTGYFKFIAVEVIGEKQTVPTNNTNNFKTFTNCNELNSVEELLFRIGLKEYTSIFILNGYEKLELFKEVEPADLDYLGIINIEHRAKLLTAVQLLHDIKCKKKR